LLHEVIIQQTMVELIHRAARLCREFFEAHPNEQGTSNMIALHPRFAALAAFQTSKLFACAVQLLASPAEATHLLSGLSGLGSRIIGHNPLRAVGRHRNPATLHRVVFRKTFELERLAVTQFVCGPCARIHPLIGALAASIIDLPIVFERAVVQRLLPGTLVDIFA
jgi:hypothetical protein